jgi:uncharacterized protein (TIGR02271 family)
LPEKQNSIHTHHNEGTLQLHKEELQFDKKRIETADVSFYKRTFTVEKEILIPVTCEELIIEKKLLNSEGTKEPQIETIRIPLSEERIEVSLHPTVLNDVDIYKKQFEDLKHVNETVKEEKVHIDTVGDIKVIQADESTP